MAQQLDRERRGDPPPPVSMIVADSGNGLIRRVKEDGTVATVQANVTIPLLPDEKASAGAGLKGKGRLRARFKSPQAVAADPFGNIYVSEPGLRRIQTILQSGDIVSATESKTFASPKGIVTTQGAKVVVADSTSLARQISYGEPDITNIAPERVSSRGGETVAITGKNFGPGTLIIIAGQIINTVQSRNSNSLIFTAPVLPSGLTTLTVQNRAGLAQKQFLVEAIPLNQLPVGYVTTVAGGGTFAGDGSLATGASLSYPTSIAFDSQGNLYIADGGNQRVRKVVANTGIITTIAGTGEEGFSGDNGPATAAKFYLPYGVAVDSASNLYISDRTNHRIRKVAATTGIVTTIAGTGVLGYSGDNGPATAAMINFPAGIFLDSAENLYIADEGNNRIRKVTAATGIISTVAGTGEYGFSGDGGLATAAMLRSPRGVFIDSAGNILIVDFLNHRIRKVAANSGIITTVAGSNFGALGDNGLAIAAGLLFPSGVVVDSAGNIFIADSSHFRIRKVSATTGIITTVAGTGIQGYSGDNGLATAAKLSGPAGIALDSSGNFFVADSQDNHIRKVSTVSGIITTVAGTEASAFLGDNGPATAAKLDQPYQLAFDSIGNLFIADLWNQRIRKISSTTGIITTVAGTGEQGFSGDNGPASAAKFRLPSGVAVDAAGNLLISDSYNHRIRKVSAATGIITTVVGRGGAGYSGDNGLATTATLYYPHDIALDRAGNLLFADSYNHRIRRVSLGTGIITTIAGNGSQGYSGDDGPATAAMLNQPYGIALDAAGNLFVSDTSNHRIRKVAALTRIITTVAGTGTSGYSGDNGAATAAQLNRPYGITVDSAENLLIADSGNSRIRKISATTGIITTLAGKGEFDYYGFSGDDGPAIDALFSGASGIALDAQGNIYITDSRNDRIRAVRGPIP